MKQIFIALFALFHVVAFSQNTNIQLRSEMSFPGETVANIYGYAAGGHEYALVGGSLSTHIVDITNPDAPVLVKSIPFVNSLWKEIRVYKNVAYVTTEGGGAGLQVIDLSPLPNSTDLPNYRYYGDGPIAGGLLTIHALQVDTTKGFLYLYGANLANGGAVVCDISAPYTPVYAGKYDTDYIHDGYADNDTLYGGHIYGGYFSVIDMSDKNNPVVLATQPTPNLFTHNTWITKDRKHLLTTDETTGSYLTMYDIGDLSDIKEVDRLQCTPGSGSIAHNTYVLGDYAITAWYTDGVNIVDCTRPENMVQVGWYDTYPGSGSGFEGAWGVYPYLPSGNLIVSNINPGKIILLTPTYTRASYFEGTVTDAQTGAPISGATIVLENTATLDQAQSNSIGAFKAGANATGSITVKCTKLGYLPQTVTVELVAGEVVSYDFQLATAPTYTVGGVVKDAQGTPIPNAKVVIQQPDASYTADADGSGLFQIGGVLPATYTAYAGLWGYKNGSVQGIDVSGSTQIEIVLEPGYKDDFAVDQGWTVSGTSLQGQFELVEPIGVAVQGVTLTPETDLDNDLGDRCYVTGNTGQVFWDNDLQEGNTVLRSPKMDLTGYTSPKLRFSTAFISATDQGQVTAEKFKVWINNGTQEKLLLQRASSFDSGWKTHTYAIPGDLPLTDSMFLRVEVKENLPGQSAITEGSFDGFEVINGTSGTDDLLRDLTLFAQPNPFQDAFVLYLPEGIQEGVVLVCNVVGQVVSTQAFAQRTGQLTLGKDLQPGIYFVAVQSANGTTPAIKLIKS